MWSFKAPGMLLLLLFIPGLVYLIHFRKKRGGRLVFNFSVWQAVVFSPRLNWAKILNIFLWCLFWTGMLLLILALAGPMVVEKNKIFLTRGIDMIIVLDESPSMSAEDFKPVNRFESAKQVIRDFTQARENDQIGLVTFSSEAVLRVPPTLDYPMLLAALDELRIMELGEGTAIGCGIGVAALHLKTSQSHTRVIILITDGVNNEGTILPEEAAGLAMELGIRIYTIGIGRESDQTWTFVHPKTGQEYIATGGEFDEKLLMKIAGLSGGKYFYAGKPSTLEEIFEEIDSREKSEKRIRISVKRDPRQNSFILPGLLLVLCSFLCRKGLLREIF